MSNKHVKCVHNLHKRVFTIFENGLGCLFVPLPSTNTTKIKKK